MMKLKTGKLESMEGLMRGRSLQFVAWDILVELIRTRDQETKRWCHGAFSKAISPASVRELISKLNHATLMDHLKSINSKKQVWTLQGPLAWIESPWCQTKYQSQRQRTEI